MTRPLPNFQALSYSDSPRLPGTDPRPETSIPEGEAGHTQTQAGPPQAIRGVPGRIITAIYANAASLMVRSQHASRTIISPPSTFVQFRTIIPQLARGMSAESGEDEDGGQGAISTAAFSELL